MGGSSPSSRRRPSKRRSPSRSGSTSAIRREFPDDESNREARRNGSRRASGLSTAERDPGGGVDHPEYRALASMGEANPEPHHGQDRGACRGSVARGYASQGIARRASRDDSVLRL